MEVMIMRCRDVGLKYWRWSLTGVAIAYSTVIFQTITHNRILTPSVMGLDSLYMFPNFYLLFLWFHVYFSY